MEALGRLDDGTGAEEALGFLVSQYREWIDFRGQDLAAGSSEGDRRDTAGQLLRYAGIAAERMARGVGLLRKDAERRYPCTSGRRALSVSPSGGTVTGTTLSR